MTKNVMLNVKLAMITPSTIFQSTIDLIQLIKITYLLNKFCKLTK